MSNDSPQLYHAALSLTDSERADLAYQLLQSLRPADVLSEENPDYHHELERRMAAYEAGETTASD